MKKKILGLFIFGVIITTCFSVDVVHAKEDGGSVGRTCQVGGPGATSCTITGVATVAGIEAPITHSVTCGAGYYACCNKGMSGAKCIENGK